MEPDIQREFQRRGIHRLCHFTPLENLTRIFARDGILSVDQAQRRGTPLSQMDSRRLDGRLSHVSLSIEYPNAFLMRNYGHVRFPDDPGARRQPMAVLDIDPFGVQWADALFAPTNAAAAAGQHLGSGLTRLRTLFGASVPNPKCPPRSDRHPPQCPTDLQAEVMIATQVPATAIRRIFVELDEHLRAVHQLGLPAPTLRWPAIFDPNALSTAIRQGNPPRPPRSASGLM